VRRHRRSRFVIVESSPVFARRRVALSLILGLALLAGGCGRRGPLEPPPNPSATPTPSSDTGEPEVHHKQPPITPPKTPFVLDPIL
jgi:predicted small lipoprotein YifL